MDKRAILEQMKRNGLILFLLGALLAAFGGYQYVKADNELGKLDQMVLE